MTEKTKKHPKLLLVLSLLALFTPLSMFPMLWMGNQSATFLIFCLLVELSFPLYIYYLLKNPKDCPNLKSPVLLLFLGFLLMYFISSVFGADFFNSFWSNGMRFTGHFLHLHIVAYVLYLALLLRWHGKTGYKTLLTTVSIVGAIAALYGILEYFGIIPTYAPAFLPRASSVFGNPTLFGSFLTIPFFFAVLASLHGKTKKHIWLHQLLAIIILGGVFASGARGALVGIAVGLVIGLITRTAKEKKDGLRKKLIWASVLITIVAGFSFGIAYHNSSEGSLSYRITHFTSQNSSERLILWGVAWEGFKEKPWLGQGYENFYTIAESKFNPEQYQYSNIWPDKPHNQLLEILSTGGIFTFLLYLALLGFMAKTFFLSSKQKKFSNTDSSVLLAALAGYVAQSIFLFDTVASWIIFSVLLTLALYTESTPKCEQKECKIPSWSKKTVPVMLLIGSLALILFILRPILLDLYTLDKASDLQMENMDRSIELVQTMGTHGFEFDSNIAASTTKSILTSAFLFSTFTDEQRAILIDTMIEQYDRTIELHPNRAAFLYEYVASEIPAYRYMKYEPQIEEWIEKLDKLQGLVPKRTEIAGVWVQIGLAYISVDKQEEALAYLKEKAEANPDKTTYKNLVFAMIGYFNQNELYQTSASLLETLIEQYPEDPEFYTNLASIYHIMGDIDKAIETAELLLDLGDQYQENVDWFKEQILTEEE